MSLPIKIKLPEGFLEEEIRCGYTVTKKLKQIWAVQLDLAQKFHEICYKHGITYSIYWGTLLGAVRHKGFIPWDDDFDVVVDRKNFNKLCKLPQSEFGFPYFFQTTLSDCARVGSGGRLRNSLTTGIISGDESLNCNNGIYIDVYVFDGVAPNRFFLYLHTFLKRIVILPFFSRCEASKHEKNRYKRLLYKIIRSFAYLIPFKLWWWIYSQVISMFTPFTNKIGAADSCKEKDNFEYWIFKEQLQVTKPVPFEFLEFDSIVDEEDFLRRRYHNFMNFPPVSERGKWHEGVIHFESEIPYKEYLSKK